MADCAVTMLPDKHGCYSLEGGIPLQAMEELAQLGVVERLSITKMPLLTIKLAERLERIRVKRLWLWCRVTARAMRHVIRIPSLRELDVFGIERSGRLPSFGDALQLQVLRANHGMSEDDLCQVAQCAGLRHLGAQGAELTRTSLSAILALPALNELDLESTHFDDAMAKRLSRSTTIQSLDIGATRLTRVGLAHLVQMPQLRALDLWATRIGHDDLGLLRTLPDLEYVSLGSDDGADAALDPNAVTKLLLDLPSLKRVWLDGVGLEASQRAALEAKLESLRVTEH